MAETLVERLRQGEVLTADGATGTNLQRLGLPRAVPPDAWVLEAPDKVLSLHQAFVEAGSDIILTDTFGANKIRLAGSRFGERVVELNRNAAQLARQAAGSRQGVLVAGSMGPTGQLMKPLGPLTRERAIEGYAEQARALADGGVDFLLVETMYALEEALAAVEGARQAGDLAVVCTFSFDRGLHTMMGVTPEQVVEALRTLGLSAMGANCGRSLEDMAQIVTRMMAAKPGVPLWIKPNAGMPKDGELGPEYDLSPEDMAQHVVRFVETGAQVVGGCCGTSPDHVHAFVQAVRRLPRS